ncbi:hypothetical protein [Synechococcus elongatus]|uniref:Uncharacterized protein n=1 Tax=Synechococcus elongatus PCC 11802 TaxID=2283154 RepID=A0AAT9JXZ0_SYNEL|nr:hypothetical protein [Synechococcus elongatus]QFZ91557.1 hypothetical protein EKO22_03435 [Synechococcus elongatus PCC 11802]
MIWAGVLLATTPCQAPLEAIAPQLLQDLPAYANRSVALLPNQQSLGSVLTAGQLDLTPLSLPLGSPPPQGTQQLFFTTLERSFLGQHSNLSQGFHWLFVTPSDRGWQFVSLYSQWGPYPLADRPTTPPQESSGGRIGQAVQTWLRDCRANFLSAGSF